MAEHTLKFPVLENIEYIDIIKKGVALLSLKGSDVNKKTWRQFQVYVGDKIPAGNYYYNIKQLNNPKIHKGTMKAIGTIPKPSPEVSTDPNVNSLKKNIESLTSRIESLSQGGGVTVDMLIEVTKSSYQNQISFLNIEVTKKTNDLERLQLKYDDLEIERDDYRDQLKESSGIAQYITLAKQFLDLRTGKAKPIENLADSNPQDIPPAIIEVLGVIDWGQVDEAIIYDIVNYLKIFATKLPLKGA